MKKLIVASALAFTTLAGLATSPKVQASSTAKSAKVSFKQYKKTKTYKNGLTVKYSYNLPQLKGKSAAIKKINKALLKKYRETSNPSKSIFPSKSTQGDTIKKTTHYDLTKISVSYNKNSIISFKVDRNWWAGYQTNNKKIPYHVICGWTYSLKSGKLLGIMDTAKGNKASIQKKLNAGAAKAFGLKKGDGIITDIHLIYYLKNGKLYLYPDIIESLNYEFTHHNPPIYYNSHFTIPSRYK
ncbi:hypothetical protein [Lactobacillus equicursoris]|uniref:hypothetical protein n=1 Tax=Lactobacillus equicursoris TaxID=420645 RepID=UPI0024321175|nr:hypothetical protein [Lactobacillus equicursoris]MDD6386915.1 hypothetical protein [Lactobacillus equicursoris]